MPAASDDVGSQRDRVQAHQLVLLEAAEPTDLEQWLESPVVAWCEFRVPGRRASRC